MKELAFSIAGKPILMPGNLPSVLTGDPNTALNTIIQTAVNLLFAISIASALFFLMYSGILWITSGGDKEKIQKARARITYAIIGLIVIMASFVIVSIVITLVGGNAPWFFMGP